MKIIHCLGDSQFGGGTAIVGNLARLSIEHGHNVSVLTTNRETAEYVTGLGCTVVDLDCIWRPIRPIRDYIGARRLRQYFRANHYDIVHTHTSKAGFVGRWAARGILGTAVVHTVHGFAFHESSPLHKRYLFTLLERRAAHWCDALVTVSNFHRRWALELGIGSEKMLRAIPNGIPDLPASPDAAIMALRTSLGVQPGSFLLAYIGRLAPQKGLDTLIRALDFLEGNEPGRYRLVLVGDGPQRAALEQQVANLRSPKSVTFVGFRHDITSYLAACDASVLPSLWEGLSITLLEGLAASRPVVVSGISPNREVVEHGVTGLVHEPGDANSLAACIQSLARDPALCRRLGSQARSHFLATYTVPRMLSAYADLYTEVSQQRFRR